MLSARVPVDGEREALSSTATGTSSPSRLLRATLGERVCRRQRRRQIEAGTHPDEPATSRSLLGDFRLAHKRSP
jgi:hypothetical protein